jgi:AcrR family transcriptional regulator
MKMPVDRRTRRAGGARRAAVLEAAAAVLADRGYENTRYADVSMTSGVAVSTLQNYFGSREDMLIEAMRQATEREVLVMETVAGAAVDPWNRLVALIDRNLDSPIQNHRLLMEFWRAGIRDGELRDYGHEGWARYRAPFAKTVIDGCDAGMFSPSISPDDIVDLLLATLTGAMVPRLLRFPSPAADRFRTALLQQVAQMLGRAGYR